MTQALPEFLWYQVNHASDLLEISTFYIAKQQPAETILDEALDKCCEAACDGHLPICSSRLGPEYQEVSCDTELLVVRFSPERPLEGM